MTTKQLIRSVLKDTDKFIIGNYNGQKWYCPDGYIATIDDIYSQYKPKKSQLDTIDLFRGDVLKQPKMDTIINREGTNYIEVQHIGDVQKETSLYLFSGSHKTLVNSRYYEFMKQLYPTAKFQIDTNFYYSPIKVTVKDYINNCDKLVALIMPLKD